MVICKQQCFFNFMAIVLYSPYWSLSSLMDKEIGLHFKLGESANSSNGVMMRYVNVVRCSSQSKGNGLSD